MIALLSIFVGWALVTEWRASSSRIRRSLVVAAGAAFVGALTYYYARAT